MKLCKDCKHYEIKSKYQTNYEFPIVGFYYEDTLCRREQKFVITEMVNGNGEYEGEEKDCRVERENAQRLEEFRCGHEGKYWEAK